MCCPKKENGLNLSFNDIIWYDLAFFFASRPSICFLSSVSQAQVFREEVFKEIFYFWTIVTNLYVSENMKHNGIHLCDVIMQQ